MYVIITNYDVSNWPQQIIFGWYKLIVPNDINTGYIVCIKLSIVLYSCVLAIIQGRI